MISKEYMQFLDNLTATLGTTKDLDHAWLDFIFVWNDDSTKAYDSYDIRSAQKCLINLASLGLGLFIQRTEEGYEFPAMIEFEIIEKLKKLHADKNAGYSGNSEDPWLNFRAIESFGYAASVGCLTRLCDKFARYTILSENPDQDKVGEPIEDTLMDFVAYCGILYCLLGE